MTYALNKPITLNISTICALTMNGIFQTVQSVFFIIHQIYYFNLAVNKNGKKNII